MRDQPGAARLKTRPGRGQRWGQPSRSCQMRAGLEGGQMRDQSPGTKAGMVTATLLRMRICLLETLGKTDHQVL